MEELAVNIEIDGIPCVFDRSMVDSPMMVHKLAKIQREARLAQAEDRMPRLDPLDMDFIAERIFGEEQWEAILEQIDSKGIVYEWHFISEAIGQASQKVEDVKNC